MDSLSPIILFVCIALTSFGIIHIPIHDETRLILTEKIKNEKVLWYISKLIDCEVCKAFWSCMFLAIVLGHWYFGPPAWGLTLILFKFMED